MTVVIIAFLILALTVGILSYVSKAHYLIKATAIAGLVVMGLGLETHYKQMLGSPIEAFPQGEFLYVAHEVQGQDILLWAWTEDRGNRLYVIPFSQEVAEELAEAEEKGTEQQGRFDEDGGTHNDPSVTLIMDDWVGEYTGETKG